MKTKNLIFFFGILLLSFGCSDDNDLPKGESNVALIGKKWKLDSFVNGTDGSTKIPEVFPFRPYNCYWIQFEEGKTVNGRSSSNLLLGSYNFNFDASEIKLEIHAATELGERPDGDTFINKLNSVHSFEYRESALLLYYNEKDYLLFKLVNNEVECDWQPVSALQISDELHSKLNGIFSILNEKMNTIEGDTLLFVIDDREDIEKLQPYSEFTDIWAQIDWTTQSIVWGRVFTSSISDSISTKQLFECNHDILYKYDVQIEKCTECWETPGYHYFWGVYPRKISQDNISLTIKMGNEYNNNPLLGEWREILPHESGSVIKFFENGLLEQQFAAPDNSVYTSSYQFISEDSIQISRGNWVNDTQRITRNKLVFSDNNTLVIENFTPSDAAVFPPEYGDIKLVKLVSQ